MITEREYKAMMALFDAIVDEGHFIAPEYGRLVDVMADYVQEYEKKHFPMEEPTPKEARKFRLSQEFVDRAARDDDSPNTIP